MKKSLSLMNQKTALCLSIAAAVALPAAVMAGTGGTEFDAVWTLLTDWSQGALGRIIAGSMVLIGIIAGIARQSLMSFAVGIGGGVGLFYAPTIIDATVTGTLQLL
jgi:conjugal transfer pilus assembly protein TraA